VTSRYAGAGASHPSQPANWQGLSRPFWIAEFSHGLGSARVAGCNLSERKLQVRTGFLIVVVLIFASITLDQSAHGKKGNWISLFNGKDLTGWHLKNPAGPNGWKVQEGVYVNTPPSTDIQTDSEYYDFQLHVEFNVSPGMATRAFTCGINTRCRSSTAMGNRQSIPTAARFTSESRQR